MSDFMMEHFSEDENDFYENKEIDLSFFDTEEFKQLSVEGKQFYKDKVLKYYDDYNKSNKGKKRINNYQETDKGKAAILKSRANQKLKRQKIAAEKKNNTQK